jgi:uncharacterized protein
LSACPSSRSRPARATVRHTGRTDPTAVFHCKDELFSTIGAEVLDWRGLARIAHGENADDAARPDRPGAHAATQHAVLRPLADAGLDKATVRRIARALGLPCADKPAAPCLASRIPHHEPVTPAKLAQVEAAERALRALGFTDRLLGARSRAWVADQR